MVNGIMESKKLTITAVLPITKVGEKNLDKLSFKAKDESGQEHLYSTFNSKLFDAIQKAVDQTMDFDIETSVNGGYTNRKVLQVYTGGEPVLIKKNTFGGGRAISPEDRASIEAQVAVKLAVELRLADKIADNSPIYKGALAWIKNKIDASPKVEV